MTVPDTQENMTKCLCVKCPTYNMCMKDKAERLFCSKGKTTCKLQEVGCICTGCPIWLEYKLGALYYCVSGK